MRRLGRLLGFHLRLAWRSLRRDRGLSASIVACLALATSVWAISASHYARIYGPRAWARPDLHHAELAHPKAAGITRLGGYGSGVAHRARVTYPEYRVLAGSGLPVRATASVRSRVAVAPEGGPPFAENAGFVNADFFALFGRAFRTGGPWTAADEAAVADVVVLGRPVANRLFPEQDPRGRALTIDGRPFQIAGVLAEHQPHAPEWDMAPMGMDQDGLFLPFPQIGKLQARPEFPVMQGPIGSSFEDLLRSDAVMVAWWIELPAPAQIDAYRRHLAARFGREGRDWWLRRLDRWRAEVPVPNTPMRFFTLLTTLVLLGGGFNLSRLFLAKGLARPTSWRSTARWGRPAGRSSCARSSRPPCCASPRPSWGC